MIPRPTRYRTHLCLLLLLGLSACSGPKRATETPSAAEIWDHVSEVSGDAGIDARFVFAIASAESSLDPGAESYNGFARGLMQMSEGAWQTVSETSWDNAWDWEENVEAGVAYLVHLRDLLERDRAFSYANLAAAYRFGPGRLKREGYEVNNLLPGVKNRIYRELLNGNPHPVPAP
jgi:soluble lytic murein transglycosylase-like protein